MKRFSFTFVLNFRKMERNYLIKMEYSDLETLIFKAVNRAFKLNRLSNIQAAEDLKEPKKKAAKLQKIKNG